MPNGYPHRIRLRGPWTCQELPEGPVQRIEMPSDLSQFRRPMVLERSFGYPGQIDVEERVWLTFPRFPGIQTIRLNDQSLTSQPSGETALEFDVTERLKPRNCLRMELAGDSVQGYLGEVALEIRCLAYLHNINLKWSLDPEARGLTITGKVVGPSTETLELYAILNRRSIGYQKIQASPEGEPFTLVAGPSELEKYRANPQDKSLVQIDLVKGGQVWYTRVEEFQLPPQRVTEENG